MYVSQSRGTPERAFTAFLGQAAAPAACTSYEKGEVEKSYTPSAHLPADAIPHVRGLLLADFGVNDRTPPQSLKGNTVLKDWLNDIVKQIAANPTTTVRILGFSDCVGSERDNDFLRKGRAAKTKALLAEVLGAGAAWKSLNSKIVFTGAAPISEYVAGNDTIEGRARNRGVLLEPRRTIDVPPTRVAGCVVRPSQLLAFPLMRILPNVPFDRAKLPLTYRLNAKDIVRQTAQDVSTHAHTAQIVVEAAHWGLVVLEIFAEVSAAAVLAPLLGLVANFLSLGSGCMQAAEEVAKYWAARGYSRGIVIGANGRKAREVRERFGRDCCPRDPFCDNERIAKANYLLGLAVGYVHGRMLCPNQREWFWRDLGQRLGDQSHLGPQSRWSDHDWTMWYSGAAGAFRGAHLE